MRLNLFLILIFFGQNLFSQTFVNYKPDLDSEWLMHLAINTEGNVFCSSQTDTLLVAHNGTEWSYYGRSEYGFRSSTDVSDLEFMPSGELWVSYMDGGLQLFDGETIIYDYVAESSSLASNKINRIQVDNSGRLFITYQDTATITMWDDEVWTHTGSFIDDLVFINELDEGINFMEYNPLDNEFWFLQGGYAHSLLDGDVSSYHIPTESGDIFFASFRVKCMTFTDDGGVWIGATSPGPGIGLYHFDGEDWFDYKEDNSDLPKNEVAILSSYENRVFYGWHKLIYQFNAGTWDTYYAWDYEGIPNGLSYFFDSETHGTNVFMATDEGLIKIDIETLSINDVQSTFFNVYPNPFNSETQIDFGQEFQSPYVMQVYDILGNVVYRNEHVKGGKLTLTKEDLGTGIFIATISNNELNEFHTLKLIVE